MQNKTSSDIIKTKRLTKNDNRKENRLETASDFEIISILGHGTYATVKQVNHLQTNEKYISREFFKT